MTEAGTRCLGVRVLLALSLAVITLCHPEYSRAAGSRGSLQRIFADASREFGVPEAVLLAVSYDETRWDDHRGAPSTSGGYGPMYLVHVPGARDPASHTLDRAAGLLHLSPAVVERNTRQNVRAAAALLATYRRIERQHRTDLDSWYGAVAAYSGSGRSPVALRFADEVYATMQHGAARVALGGQRMRLVPQRVHVDRRLPGSRRLERASRLQADCPAALVCRYVPAAYAVNNPADPTDYGNYDAARRPMDGLSIRYIVIHDTEVPYDTAIRGFQNPTRYASANYVIRSSDGEITQMVPNNDVAWHAGNYYVNMHAIGIEHEGVAIKGATWYGEQLYQASAQLVRFLAHEYNVPLDRAHIFGHDEIPGPTPSTQTGQHWDPGPYWDWRHYMELLQAPLITGLEAMGSHVVTIDPDFSANQPTITNCAAANQCSRLPTQPANFVYLHTAPDVSAPLLRDAALAGLGAVGTTRADDWGDKAVTGQQFYVVARQKDWEAIDYGGRQAWIHDPGNDTVTIPSLAQVVTPRPGLSSIAVFGQAYPGPPAYPASIPERERGKVVPLQYRIPTGQLYVMTDQVRADYYWTPTQNRHAVIRGTEVYDQISFNHRFAFVRARDVQAAAG